MGAECSNVAWMVMQDVGLKKGSVLMALLGIGCQTSLRCADMSFRKIEGGL